MFASHGTPGKLEPQKRCSVVVVSACNVVACLVIFQQLILSRINSRAFLNVSASKHVTYLEARLD